MNPFRFSERMHVRTQAPGPYKSYRRYKGHLRVEFSRQCVYCRMPDGPRGWESFGVDHYRPVSQFPHLRCDYRNLFYSCNLCNLRKRDFFPTDTQSTQGIFLPNPCDHAMSEHLLYRGALVEAETLAGELAVELLLLNDEEAVLYRGFVLRSIESCLTKAAVVSELLLALSLRRLQASHGAEREDIQRDIAGLRITLSQVAEDFERLTGTRLPGLAAFH